jgi:hypothetical protein
VALRRKAAFCFVENKLSDGIFVKHVVRIMRPDLPAEVAPDAWRIRHAGGIEMLPRLAEEEAEADRIAGLPAEAFMGLPEESRDFFPVDSGWAKMQE